MATVFLKTLYAAMDVFRQSWIQLFGLPFALLAFVGCAAGYREPSIPRDQMASLKATVPVWVVSIDGKKVSHPGITGHKQFHVSPGLHLVEVQYSQISQPVLDSHDGVVTRTWSESVKNFPVRFLATAGTTYYVKAVLSENYWKPVITDIPESTAH